MVYAWEWKVGGNEITMWGIEKYECAAAGEGEVEERACNFERCTDWKGRSASEKTMGRMEWPGVGHNKARTLVVVEEGGHA